MGRMDCCAQPPSLVALVASASRLFGGLSPDLSPPVCEYLTYRGRRESVRPSGGEMWAKLKRQCRGKWRPTTTW